jgi:membrane fusion protein (multidrug efflux system)
MKGFIIMSALFLLASCGTGRKEGNAQLTDMKVELEKLRSERDAISAKMTTLEADILKMDPASAAAENAKLVQVTSVTPKDFAHYIDLQGRIATENISYVTPRGMGGQVKAIYVKQGDNVRKGQLLLKLDDAVVRQQITSMKTQLSFAQDLFNRQQNLWKEGIGTEVQLLTAKNNVEGLERQLSLLNEQLSMSNVYAEVTGVAEAVNIRVGETFTGAPQTGITIVNPSSLKAVVDIPENYISKIKKGMPVLVDIPDMGKTINTNISLVSEVINATNRSFTAECKIPGDASLKPNQIAVIKILDHEMKNSMIAPIATIQTDEKGKFVYVMTAENGKQVARKKNVVIGEVYDEIVEIKSGLSASDQLITLGFQGLYDGQLITTK